MPVIGNYAGKTVATAKTETADNELVLKKSTPNGPAPVGDNDNDKVIVSNAPGSEAGTTVAAGSDVVVDLPT